MFSPGEIVVQKYGGSSMASPERIQKVAERVANLKRSGMKVVLVVSAMGDTTDDLINLMHRVSFDFDPREMDQLLATGEIVSCSLISTALKKHGILSRSYNAFNLGIETDDVFGAAEIKNFSRLSSLAQFLKQDGVAIVAGFQGINSQGDFTTLGRGGSDITAVALARELEQKVCEKLTDEDGIYTADPRFVRNARKVWHLSFDEMETLANYGSGILHPRAITFARESNIRIHVRSSFTKEEGSIIGPLGDPDILIKSLTCDRKQAIVKIQGIPQNSFPEKITDFPVMELQNLSSGENGREVRIGFKLSDSFQAMPCLWETAYRLNAVDVIFQSRIAVFSLVGSGFKTNKNLFNCFQNEFRKFFPNPLLVERNENRLSFAVGEAFFPEAMKTLHNTLLSYS